MTDPECHPEPRSGDRPAKCAKYRCSQVPKLADQSVSSRCCTACDRGCGEVSIRQASCQAAWVCSESLGSVPPRTYMSDAFFRDLRLPDRDVHLEVGSGTHAEQAGGVMIAYERACMNARPDWTVVVGDVNSTLACTLTAAKLGIRSGASGGRPAQQGP